MSENIKTTQRQRILDYLDEFGGITRLDGLRDLGIMNLPTRIHELRRMGYNIVSETVKVKNRWGEDCRIVKYKYGDEKAQEKTCGECEVKNTECDYFTPEQVRQMSAKEVRENYHKIVESMKRW